MNNDTFNHYAFLKLLEDPYYKKFPEEIPNCVFTTKEQYLKDKEEYESIRKKNPGRT